MEAKFEGGKQTQPRSGSAIPHVALGATSVHRQIRGAKMLQHHPVEGHSCWAESYKTINQWCEVLATIACPSHEGTTVGLTFIQSHATKLQQFEKKIVWLEVTLEIEGRIIHNVKMHTRGHSSAMWLGSNHRNHQSCSSKLVCRFRTDCVDRLLQPSSPGFQSTNLGCACPRPFLCWAWRLRGVCEMKRMLLAGLKSCMQYVFYSIVIQYLNGRLDLYWPSLLETKSI